MMLMTLDRTATAVKLRSWLSASGWRRPWADQTEYECWRFDWLTFYFYGEI